LNTGVVRATPAGRLPTAALTAWLTDMGAADGDFSKVNFSLGISMRSVTSAPTLLENAARRLCGAGSR